MSNKYQDELDKLKRWSYTFPEAQIIKPQLDNSFGTLQELIDKYNSIIGDYMSYKDLKAEYEQELAIYKKALDITIGLLYRTKCSYIIPHNRRAYKDWVLKESEN